jgi:hypothetical protein
MDIDIFNQTSNHHPMNTEFLRNDMSAKGTVIIFSLIHWHFTWQSTHNFASGLAKRGYRVLFVEPLPKRWPKINEFNRVWGRIKGNSEEAGMCVQPIIPGVEIVAPRLLPDVGTLAQTLNKRIFVPRIARSMQTVPFIKPVVVINYLPTLASIDLMQSLNPDVSFYYCNTDWENDPYTDVVFEAEMAQAVDMVWGDTPTNFDRVKKLNDRVGSMPKGVDITLFSRARKELGRPSQPPLCVYFGLVSVSTDVDLLREVSHRYRLRIIGPIRRALTGFADSTEIIGGVAHDQVPNLLYDADVLLLPYAKSAQNMAVMPAKMFECLATGKPTIVHGLDYLRRYSELFYFCENHNQFLEAIEFAINEPPERSLPRIALAEQNSYDQRVNEIEDYIEQVMAEKRIAVSPN